MLSSLQNSNLKNPHGLTSAFTHLSQPDRRRATLRRTMQQPCRPWRRTVVATTKPSTLTVQQHMATQTAVAASLSPMTLGSTVSALSRPANGARPSKPMRKLCYQPSNWYRRMSPSTRCTSFQIVCQHSNT